MTPYWVPAISVIWFIGFLAMNPQKKIKNTVPVQLYARLCHSDIFQRIAVII